MEDLDDLDDLCSLELIEKIESRKKRKLVFPRRDDFNELDEEEFLRRYRISKVTAREILCLIEGKLKNPKHPRGLSIMEQLLISLRFFATSGFQFLIADVHDVSQSTVSRVVSRISKAIASLCKDFIKMPTNKNDLEQVSKDFYRIAKFPGVIGCIDSTHIKIQSPVGPDAEKYRSREGFFSMNVQTVVDSNLFIRNVAVRSPGSLNDSTILISSSVKAKFESDQIAKDKYHILGDSGYAIKPYVLTPILKPTSLPEERYNESHILTRKTIERKFGILKRRFPCLLLGLRCNLESVPPIITACCILHNLAVKNGDPEPPMESEIKKLLKDLLKDASDAYSTEENESKCHKFDERHNTGNAKRKIIIEKCFTHV